MKPRLVNARLLKTGLIALAAFLALGATGAWAQSIAGRYHCIAGCKRGSPGPAFITHDDINTFDYNIVNEVGELARAWTDVPSHLRIKEWNEGASIDWDGATIRFDNGTVWRRYSLWEEYFEPPRPAPRVRP